MKQLNLLKEIIVVNKAALLNAINTKKEFGVTTDGEVFVEPLSDDKVYIFKGKDNSTQASLAMPQKPKTLAEIFGKEYQVVEDGDRVLIKAGGAWQKVIDMNLQNASYDDTTQDGVSEFSYKPLEDIGWYATDFDIKYRELVEFLENECDGMLVCIERDDPYQFSGMGFLANNEEAKEKLFSFVQNIIKDKLANNEDYSQDMLDDDQEEAMEFFKIAKP